MINSMTGYGRAIGETDGYSITVEIKSVNHRFFEFSARVPRAYGFLEEKLKGFAQQRIARGKVDCYVQIDCEDTPDGVVSVNYALAEGYYSATKELCERYGLRMGEDASVLTAYPDVFVVHKAPADEERVWNAVKSVAEQAVDSFLRMRAAEGERLSADIRSRAAAIAEHVSFIEARSPETVRLYNEKLTARVRELLQDASVDEQRLLTETAIFADKIAVAEETVRLRSHLSQLDSFLEAGEAIGRKLDFLVQEMNREANTIGSKASDIEIARRVIDIKAEIEKIREQIQNIE